MPIPFPKMKHHPHEWDLDIYWKLWLPAIRAAWDDLGPAIIPWYGS